MTESSVKSFHELLDGLVILNLDNRAQLQSMEAQLGPQAWARDFCTVSCDIGRRFGKTEYILRRAKKEDVIVVANRNMETFFENAPCPVFSAGEVERKVIGRRFNTVYVDEPALVFHEIERDRFFSILIGAQLFVLLGR